MSKEIITLQYPITVSGVEVSEIQIKRPKWKQIKAAQKGSGDTISQTEALIMSLCSTAAGGALNPDDIEELDIADMTAISEKIEGFTKKLK